MTPPSRSARTDAYQALRTMILTLELAPGQRLSDVQLAETLQVSRTPIREALFSLAHEDLVELTERGGFSVKNFDLAETQAAFEALHLMSRAVARKLALRASEADVTALGSQAEQVAGAMQAADPAAIAHANAEFHILEAQLCGNKFFAESIRTLHTLLQRLAFVSFRGVQELPESLRQHYLVAQEQHEELIGRYAARDAQGAEKLAGEHVELFQRRVADYFTRNDAAQVSL